MRCLICNTLMFVSYNGKYFYCPDCKMASSRYHFNSKVYDEKYAEHYESLEGSKKTIELMDIRFNWVKSQVKEKSFILDYGCGIGTFLRHVKNYYSCVGFDINLEAIKMAEIHENDGIIYCDNALKLPHVREMFDCVTMFDVIEHHEDPFNALVLVNGLIKRNGFLFISTPNTAIYNIKKIPEDWRHFKPTEHLHYFTLNSIEHLLEAAGFKMISFDFRETAVRDTYAKNILCVTAIKI